MKTFLDTGVLLAAWRAGAEDGEAALAVITDESRKLLTSEIVKLEILPKPVFFKRKKELEFYGEIFARCQSLKVSEQLYADAFDAAKIYGLSAGDAFHVAAAVRLGAEEFVTTELPGKPLFRVRELGVVTLHAASK